MSISTKGLSQKFIGILPLLLLFFISLNGSSVINIKFFSVNIHYILVYFWVLRKPESFGYGYIFLSGLISDVVLGFPLGINSLALLIVAGVAAYVRVVTVRVSLLSDWTSFIFALLIANFIYFIALYFSNYTIDYLYLLKNSLFTFIFYPVLWIIFGSIMNFVRLNSYD